MEEVQSNVGGSRHSLYPSVVCVQENSAFNRSESIVSGHSDFVNLSKTAAEDEDDDENFPATESSRLIPLADLKNELKLSVVSISSSSAGSCGGSSDSVGTTPRRRISLDNLVAAASAAGETATDGLLVLDASGRLSELDRDANDTFVSPEMIEVEEKELLLQRADVIVNDSGSDSGYSDPSIEHRPTTSAEVAVESKSPLSDIDSLDIVPATPTRGQTPVSGLSAGSSPKVIHLNSQSLRSSPRPQSSQRSSRKSSGSRRGEPAAPEDALEVLSVDNVNVINGLLVKEPAATEEDTASEQSRPGSRRSSGRSRRSVRVREPEDAYAPAARPRTEYVPPRAFATRRDTIPEEDEDEDLNGCYYFMACLDTFWIL